ncbi:PREDICTED: uncharacterized protein LOC104798901 isoform X2 [Tarenaya hassleriana]|uniref:uncharacterized protein LOC104798901 isoform X2 n=1 Tax=Tarenaya hassleriana TaxID=28532 RepID=UPI00053C0FE3|nr:PREDICTED: uncharacterized protein LOC104798901 isoform X2 [Tarenaya hassleriana]
MGSKGQSKRRLILSDDDDDDSDTRKFYRFKVLLPNTATVELTVRYSKPQMPMELFVKLVKEEYDKTRMNCGLMRKKKPIGWNSGPRFCLEDSNGNKMRQSVRFGEFKPCQMHIVCLHDGSGEAADTFENMWDLTPDVEVLKELPEDYTFVTALADLIDNSLQAVWFNSDNHRRFISVDIREDRISVFDTGSGMDGSETNSIAKWGRMGASLHRSSKPLAVGGKPPYLKPLFGMFGYGGPIASMHLGGRTLVSSKTKESKKVYTLLLERETLINRSGSGVTWKTDGGMRDPTEEEIKLSPHGSFTKVEIFEPKLEMPDISHLQCKLKDIYFPYIQCDEISETGKTEMPIEFQVNGDNLAELEGGEVAITNLNSCTGREFSFQLRFCASGEKTKGISSKANARLKFVYFPIIEGKESIERILESLEEQGYRVTDSVETFSCISVRRLGRLLPEVCWPPFPFMNLKLKKGANAPILKSCSSRVKCFIDLDAGFNPTPSKTDLAQQNPYSRALRNFGSKSTEKDVSIEMHRAGKPLSYTQLEKEFQKWVLEMHHCYDREAESTADEGILIVDSENDPLDKNALRILGDVVRVHECLKRKGVSWSRGQNIKILKGACAGVHSNNIYATIDYFLVEGFQGEAGGDARVICRPINRSENEGCLLTIINGFPKLKLQSSLSLPISIIDAGKCLAVERQEWDTKLEKERLKAPASIDLLNERECLELDIDGALPVDVSVRAGEAPPQEIVAVVRPVNFTSSTPSKRLDQKQVVKLDKEMHMEIKLVNGTGKSSNKNVQHVFSQRVSHSSRKTVHGLYFFSLGSKFPDLFKKAGIYMFSFSVGKSLCCTKTVSVKASSKATSWKLNNLENLSLEIRVGSCFPPFRIACYDMYENQIEFSSTPSLEVELTASSGFRLEIDKVKADVIKNRSILNIENIIVGTNELDRIRPSYEAALKICSKDEPLCVSVSCKVKPGPLEHVVVNNREALDNLFPDFTVRNLTLEMFDGYGNHVEEGTDVMLHLDGFEIQDQMGLKRSVDDCGCIDLSGVLKVKAGYGKSVSLSVRSSDEEIFKIESETVRRELQLVTELPEYCTAGSNLENIVFKVTNSDGTVDTSIHDDEKSGSYHTLTLKSDPAISENAIRYAFVHGCCKIPSLFLPKNEGLFCLEVFHFRHSELHMSLKISAWCSLFCILIQLMAAPESERDDTESPYPCSGNGIFPEFHPHVKIQIETAPESEREEIESLLPFSENHVLPLEVSPSSIHCQVSLMSAHERSEELFEKLERYGSRNGALEKQLNGLMTQKKEIEQDLNILQASLGQLDDASFPECLTTKEALMRKIEMEHFDSAASVYCCLSRHISPSRAQIQLRKDVIGPVALLGSVVSSSLSRILSEYLGKETMLALVCKSYESARSLERYGPNGVIDHEFGIHAEAAKLQGSVASRFTVICLERIRHWKGGYVKNDPLKRLSLGRPRLPNGDMVPGFLGYAVNMIDLASELLSVRISSGYGLRDTLFYALFKTLHVYETRNHLEAALPYINGGAAVSLDGAIVKEDGFIRLGSWRPEMYFPVSVKSEETQSILKEIEAKRDDLRTIVEQITGTDNSLRKVQKKFSKRKNEYEGLLGSVTNLPKRRRLEFDEHVAAEEDDGSTAD